MEELNLRKQREKINVSADHFQVHDLVTSTTSLHVRRRQEESFGDCL